MKLILLPVDVVATLSYIEELNVFSVVFKEDVEAKINKHSCDS